MGAFGATGPWRGFRGLRHDVEQASGLPFVNGEPDDPRRCSMRPMAIRWPACSGAIACLIGLYDHASESAARSSTSARSKACSSWVPMRVIAQSLQRPLLAREGSRHPLAPLRCVCATNAGNKWIAVTVETPVEWKALANAIGRADLAFADSTVDELKRHEHVLEAGCATGVPSERERRPCRRCRLPASAPDRSTPRWICWRIRNCGRQASGAAHAVHARGRTAALDQSHADARPAQCRGAGRHPRTVAGRDRAAGTRRRDRHPCPRQMTRFGGYR